MDRIRARLGIALAVALGGVVAPSPSSAAAAGAPCDYVGFSPAFAIDGDAMCVHARRDPTDDPFHVEEFVVHVTGDGGRTWRRAEAAGLDPGTRASRVTQVVFSPRYGPRDRRVYVKLGGRGFFVTTDFGRSFTALADVANFPDADTLTPFVMPLGDGELRREVSAFAYAYPGGACFGAQGHHAVCESFPHLWIDDDTVPVVGGQHFTTQFLVPPAYPDQPPLAFVARFVVGSGTGDRTHHLLECDPAFTCTTVRHSFPKGSEPGRYWLSPDYVTDQTFVVEVLVGGRELRFYRTTDGGRSFRRWTAAEKLAAQALAHADKLSWSLAFDPERARTAYLRLSTARPRRHDSTTSTPTAPGSPPAVPAEQVFRTTNDGTSWSRVAIGNGIGQRHRGATIPWTSTPDEVKGHAAGGIFAPGGGKLFALAQRDTASRTDYAGIWCSRDNGRTWARNCPR